MAVSSDPVTIDSVIQQWSLWMHGMSPRTIVGRVQLVELFARRSGIDPVRASWQAIAAFLAAYASAGTRQTYQAHLRAFYQWLVLMDMREDNPMDKLHKAKSPRRLPHPITTDELGMLLSSGIYVRTRAMIILGAFQGLRAHEIAKMRGELLRGDQLRVIGKGGVEATLDAHPMLMAIAPYFPDVGWWFPSPDDRSMPMLANSVSNVLSKAMARAGVIGTGHSLRHWYCTEMLEGGADIRVVQIAARHANIANTQIYTKVRDQRRRDAILSLPVPLHVVGGRKRR